MLNHRANIGYLFAYKQNASLICDFEEAKKRTKFGDFGMRFRLRWVYEGYFDIILLDFQKTFISPINFNNCI